MKTAIFLNTLLKDNLIDTVKPIAVISSLASPSTPVSPIPVVIQFTKDVTGFTIGDLTVGNGTKGTFVTVNGSLYTVNITPSGAGPLTVTVDIGAGTCADISGNTNSASVQFSIVYTGL